eukprot:644693-Lingulodinium_polyedra.AAC.1
MADPYSCQDASGVRHILFATPMAMVKRLLARDWCRSLETKAATRVGLGGRLWLGMAKPLIGAK